MREKKVLNKFIFPKMSCYYILRALTVAMIAYVFFFYICIPIKINGISMEPTYKDGAINLIWRPVYYFREPEPSDVVGVRLAGRNVMLLKRVVALEDDTVAFHKGKLIINGTVISEPYVELPCNWEMSARKVEKGKVYVVGDNRSVNMKNHVFGQVDRNRIMGVTIW